MRLSITVACIATGPSLTLEQIAVARAKGFRLFGVNNVYRIVPDLELTYACNEAWWDEYWGEIKDHPCEKWTTNQAAADRYHLNWIEERGADGLSTTCGVIHHGHGGGFSLLSMAHQLGAQRVILLGYDLRYAADYNASERRSGSTPRHSLLLLPSGEYPERMRHWPSVSVQNGRHVELCRLYRTVADQGLIEIVNATPGSAIEAFPRKEISEC